jgi:hypothetical protein
MLNSNLICELRGAHFYNSKIQCESVSSNNGANADQKLDNEFSILRNSFLDLYASDVKLMPLEYLLKVVKNDSLFRGYLKSPYSKKILYSFMIWKEDHLVYFAPSVDNPNLAFVVPNSVYKNIDTYCKK